MNAKRLLVTLVVGAICIGAAVADTVRPVSVSNKAIGGGDIAGTPTKGTEKGVGVNNIGLLIKTWGKVTYKDPTGTFMYINDGSNLQDGTTATPGGAPILGVRVTVADLAPGNSITLPDLGSYVAVVGISSTFVDSSAKVRPNLRPRDQADVQVLKLP